jgi:hypothetical protein
MDSIGNLYLGRDLKYTLILGTIITGIIAVWFFSPLIRRKKKYERFAIPKTFYVISFLLLFFGILLGLFPSDSGFLWLFSFLLFFSCSEVYFVVRCFWDRPYDLFTTMFPFLTMILILRVCEYFGTKDWSVSIAAAVVLVLMIIYLFLYKGYLNNKTGLFTKRVANVY